MTDTSSDPAVDAPPLSVLSSDSSEVTADDVRFAAITRAVAAEQHSLAEGRRRLVAAPTPFGQESVQRDAELRRLDARLLRLRDVSLDACLGRMTPADGSGHVYIGRIGLRDENGRTLLVDWRSPAAEPYFAATRSRPEGLMSRRRYRWSGGTLRDHWDESLGSDPAGEVPDTARDEDSAFLDALAEARTPRMRDVLATIAADQDAIVRADARRPLVVDGGPGTGKTVVALHRAAYLQYADRRLREGRGRLLVLGPHRPYLEYVSDVLPNLGENDVLTATLADLVPEGRAAVPEEHDGVRRLKEDARMLAAVEAAIRFSEDAPTTTHEVETPYGVLVVTPGDWAEACTRLAPSTPHNLARPEILDELTELLVDRLPEAEEDPVERIRAAVGHDEELVAALHGAWPLLSAPQVLTDLWEVPALLRHCAPWLTAEDRAALRRSPGEPWTLADLPLLDAARDRLGDRAAEARERRRAASRRRSEEEMDRVVEDLIASDDSDLQQMSMLKGADLRGDLTASVASTAARPETLEGPFLHVVVDEAQELSDTGWAMVLRRCPSRSLTIVGDRAQASEGFDGTWQERLARVGLDRVELAPLSVNYRTPREIMDVAAPVILEAIPDANVPTSIRSSQVPVRTVQEGDLGDVLAELVARNASGTIGVIGADPQGMATSAGIDTAIATDTDTDTDTDRVRFLSPALAKGLEFDVVVLVDPEQLGVGRAGAVARYVAMTRATRELVIVHTHRP